MAVLGVLILMAVVAGLWRLFKGTGRADRLLAVQLLGTSGTALLLLMAEWFAQPALRDAALVLALLAAVLSAALVQVLRRPDGE